MMRAKGIPVRLDVLAQNRGHDWPSYSGWRRCIGGAMVGSE